MSRKPACEQLRSRDFNSEFHTTTFCNENRLHQIEILTKLTSLLLNPITAMPPRKRLRASQPASATPTSQAKTPTPVDESTPPNQQLLNDPWTDEEETALFKGLMHWKPTGMSVCAGGLTDADAKGRLMDIRNPQAFPSSGAASRLAEQRPHPPQERTYQTSRNLAKVGDAV